MEERIFVVPLKKVFGAICGIPTYKVTGIAEKIKGAVMCNDGVVVVILK